MIASYKDIHLTVLQESSLQRHEILSHGEFLEQNIKEIYSPFQSFANAMNTNNTSLICPSLVLISQMESKKIKLQIIQYFNILERLLFLLKTNNEDIKNLSMNVLIHILNGDIIDYSINFNIIPFLIGIINTNNMSLGFSAIQCLSIIARHSYKYQDMIIFLLANLNVFKTIPTFSEWQSDEISSQTETEYQTTECVYDKITKKYVTYQLPGIAPEEKVDTPIVSEDDSSIFKNLLAFIKYNFNNNINICVPSIELITAILNFPLHKSIVTFCLSVIVDLLFISTEEVLDKLLNALFILSKQSKELWHDAFQISQPAKWLGPLFGNQSERITRKLMLFVSNVIQKGEIIVGMPLNLLIEKLSYTKGENDDFIVNIYAAIAVDGIIIQDKSVIDTLINLGLLQITINMYQQVNFAAKMQMSSYLASIAQFGLTRHKQKMLELGLIDAFLETIENSSENQIQRSILALNELFSCASKINRLPECIQRIQNSINMILEFQNHSNKSIASTASFFVQRFLSDQEEEEYEDDSPTFNF